LHNRIKPIIAAGNEGEKGTKPIIIEFSAQTLINNKGKGHTDNNARDNEINRQIEPITHI
jgi:hypothetical protein